VNVLKAIRTRRSIGRVTGDVPDVDLRQIVEAGLWAPNHKLSDPLKFIALRGDARKRLGIVWATAEAHRTGSDVESRIAKDGQKPLRAPVILMVSVRTSEDAVRAEEDYATGAAATQNVLLAAHALGYGAIWRSGDMIRSPEVRSFLELDPTDRIVAAVYVGEPVEEPPTAPEREVDKHLTILR
jgi:nitroreductase